MQKMGWFGTVRGHSSSTPTCDGQTDKQTDRHRAMVSTADAQHRAVKRRFVHGTSEGGGVGGATTAQGGTYGRVNLLELRRDSSAKLPNSRLQSRY